MNKTTIGEGLSVLLGLLILLAGTWAGAAVIAAGRLPEAFAPVLAYAALALGAFLAAFTAAVRAPGHKLLLGLLAALLLLCVLALLSLFMRSESLSASGAGLTSAVCLLAGLAGALPGALHQPKRRH